MKPLSLLFCQKKPTPGACSTWLFIAKEKGPPHGCHELEETIATLDEAQSEHSLKGCALGEQAGEATCRPDHASDVSACWGQKKQLAWMSGACMGNISLGEARGAAKM